MTVRANRDVQGGLIGGAVVIVIGLAFLLDNLGIISVNHLIHFWPMIMVVAGLAALTTTRPCQGRSLDRYSARF